MWQSESIRRAWDMGGLTSRRPWLLQGPVYTDPHYKAQNYTEVAHFEKRRELMTPRTWDP